MVQHIFNLFALCLLCFPTPVVSYTHYRNSKSCDLVGDTDIYGIGIRLSLYIQSFTAIVALLGAETEDLFTLRVGCNAIATAIVFNFLKEIPRKGFLYLEFWIIVTLLLVVLWIFNWISLFLILKPVVRDTTPRMSNLRKILSVRLTLGPITDKEEFWGTLNQSVRSIGYINITYTYLLLSMLLGIQIWLYFSAIRQGYHSECKAKMNFYVNTDIYDQHWVNFLRAVCLISVPVFFLTLTPFLLLYSMQLLGFFSEFEQVREDEPKLTPSTTWTVKKWLVGKICKYLGTPNWPYKTPPRNVSRQKASFLAKVCTGFGLFAFFSSIIWTENTIQANNIDLSGATISSSGQLISLIVTAFTSVPTLWSVFVVLVKWLKRKWDRIWQDENASTDETTNGIELEQETQNVGPAVAEGQTVDASEMV